MLGTLVGLWIARYLGPEQYGVLGYCTALVTLIGFLPSLGLDAVVKRDFLIKPGKAAEVMASALVLRLVAGGASYIFVLAATLGRWGMHGEEPRLVAILGLLSFQPALLAPDLWLQASLHARSSVTVQLFALLLCSLLRITLIVAGGSLAEFAFIVVVEMALTSTGLWLAAYRLEFRLSLYSVQRAVIKSLLREAWPLMLSTLAITVYMKIDEVMLRQLAGPAAVGIYSAAVKLSELWYFIPVAVASSILPALLRSKQNDAGRYVQRQQQYYDLSAAAAYGLSIPIALLAPWIVRLAYGAEFAAAGPILAVHIWSSIFVFLGVARQQWLVNEGLQKFLLVSTCAGAAANVALNFVFIPRWGGVGAAWATVISYGLAAWLASYFHHEVRQSAAMQTRALLIPILAWRYLRD